MTEKNFGFDSELFGAALGDEDLEGVAGGVGPNDENDNLHYLNNFLTREVQGVPNTNGMGILAMRDQPNGAAIDNFGWRNGDKIRIHSTHCIGGWGWAYKDGPLGIMYGYVNMQYVH